MELIAAVLLAGPIGYFAHTRRQGLLIYLGVWTVVFPIQTVVVFTTQPEDANFMYFVVNAAILALGLGLNTLGARLRQRRVAQAAQ